MLKCISVENYFKSLDCCLLRSIYKVVEHAEMFLECAILPFVFLSVFVFYFD